MPVLKVVAPLSGWILPLDEVPDPVFSGRILGDGVALDPTGTRLRAPCDGVIGALAAHAVTIRAENGAEILVHVGLDTVTLQGNGFKTLARQGQTVRAGDAILEFDLGFLARHAKSLASPVILANGESFRIARRVENQRIAAGEFLMEVMPVAATAVAAAGGEKASRSVTVAAEHGLHARPAALLANAARRFAGEITIACRGRSANAKSAVAIMALGVRRGDEVALAATGAEARAAVDALAAVLDTTPKDAPVLLEPALPTLPANTATRIHGICAAPGRSIGNAVRLHAAGIAVPEQGSGIAAETEHFRRALAELRSRLETAASSGSRARRDILAAHIALLDDPELHEAARKTIEQGKSAAFAWRKAVRAYADVLKGMDDARMRERAGDLLDLERQVLAILTGKGVGRDIVLPPAAILIAEEILPSDLAGLDPARLCGFVSAGGGPTSHVAILAAGMNIPALVGAGSDVLQIPGGSEVLLDADAGFVDLQPAAEVAASVRKAKAAAGERQAHARAQAGEDCTTADGKRVEVFANLGKGAEEAAEAVKLGAEGCGVLRTEFLFLDRAAPPDEAEQQTAYQGIAEALGGRSFILRTFDIGADKPAPYLTFPPEDNPQLGLRGVRVGFAWPDLLRTQLRAALRVKPAGSCKIMLPMITEAGEIAAVRAMIEELRKKEGLPPIALGAMIETPSAALLADQIAREADFLSIGTNDLTQYVLAIDRGHRQLSAQLDALHPAVLRLIAATAAAGNKAGKTVAICGGVAADIVAAPLLIGLGIGELSVPAPAIPRLKASIRRLNTATCRAAAEEALALESSAAVRAFVKARFGEEVTS